MLKRQVIKWVVRTVGGLLLILLAFVTYTRFPSGAIGAELELDPAAEYVVILLHGVGGEESPVLLEIAESFRVGLKALPATEVVYYHWAPWSDSYLRSGAHGVVLARQLARELATLPNLRHIRLITHSAGARFPDPLCETYKNLVAKPAHIEATFIDGMGMRGFLDYTYGYRNFGRCVDFASAYFTHDAEAPATNEPLDHAYNTDVSDAPGRAESGLDAHRWPLGYFLAELDKNQMQPGARSHTGLARGTVVRINAD
ncbi:MAG: hypothetical protein CL799_08985 [Chromatiales bacterium]|jgi:hypothetical protein|nr:hypothetical protein [Chromatiales bacterium]MDP6150224.1 hypothetical protein [Gammaproteobacteria bacterium]MDP7271559.1 hypothetical protein [Gammaproteobacteria bacterium]HJP04891.1 hypothetical protein [Gammaproteobacteria bacterium]